MTGGPLGTMRGPSRGRGPPSGPVGGIRSLVRKYSGEFSVFCKVHLELLRAILRAVRTLLDQWFGATGRAAHDARRPPGSFFYLSLRCRARLGEVSARRVRLGSGSAHFSEKWTFSRIVHTSRKSRNFQESYTPLGEVVRPPSCRIARQVVQKNTTESP